MSDSYDYYGGQDVAPGYDYSSGYDFGNGASGTAEWNTPAYSNAGSSTTYDASGRSLQQQPQRSWLESILGGSQNGRGGLGQGAILGSLGPLAALLGQAISGSQGQSQGYRMPFQAGVAGNQMQGALGQQNQQAMYNTPLQQMQMSLLQALQSGQGLPQGYQKLIEQAYQPVMGDIASQAIDSARNRGFAGGAELLNSGPGGAIAGPALANLQGQMAGSKLGLMQSLPGMYNQPIAAQGQAMNSQIAGYGNLMDNYRPYAQQNQQMPWGQMWGQGIGNIFAGANAGANAVNQGNNQQTLFDYLRGMSRTRDTGNA